MDPVIWQSTVATSLEHSFLFSRYVLPYMQAKKSGRIIFTSSSAAHFSGGMSGYVLGKMGQVRLAEIIHVENFRQNNIKCFAYTPGGVKTRFYYDFEDRALGREPAADSIAFKEKGAAGQEKSAAFAYSMMKDMPFDEPSLAAGCVTALAAGKLNFMSGRYVDSTVSIEDYIRDAEKIRALDLHRIRLRWSHEVHEPVVDF